MADTLPNPHEMRAKARQHRDSALQIQDVERRRLQLLLADEYDLLADAIEAELGELAPRPLKS